jgi:hypothetical protein
MDMGAFVVVINADQVEVTGNKPAAKTYFRHVNGRPGSWNIESFNQLQKVSSKGAVGHSNRVYMLSLLSVHVRAGSGTHWCTSDAGVGLDGSGSSAFQCSASVRGQSSCVSDGTQ